MAQICFSSIRIGFVSGLSKPSSPMFSSRFPKWWISPWVSGESPKSTLKTKSLTCWWTPLKNMKVNWDDYSQYANIWKNENCYPNHQPANNEIMKFLVVSCLSYSHDIFSHKTLTLLGHCSLKGLRALCWKALRRGRLCRGWAAQGLEVPWGRGASCEITALCHHTCSTHWSEHISWPKLRGATTSGLPAQSCTGGVISSRVEKSNCLKANACNGEWNIAILFSPWLSH